MSLDPRTPVLIGTGQFLHRDAGLDGALDASALMAEAVRLATTDAGLAAVPQPDSWRVVSLLSWRYGDPAWVVAQHLGLQPRDTVLTTMGGNVPQTLLNTTAAEIQRGDLDLAVLTGGEAWRSRTRARAAGAQLAWPKAPEEHTPRVLGDELDMSHPAELACGVTLPVQVYAMFESALRARAGRSVDEQQRVASELWARFSQVAAGNPNAWIRTPKSAEQIRTPTDKNRYIGYPYTKSMVSNMDVDMAAALLVCSVAKAQALGVPRDRWVFLRAGTDNHDHNHLSDRRSFVDPAAIRIAGQRALELAGLGIDDIDIVDLYSCFPSAVQLAAEGLGLPLEHQLTRTGGMSFAGGPWNNYAMHSIATVAREVRERPGTNGLVWANGGLVTKNSFGIFSTTPPAQGYRHDCPQAEIDASPTRPVALQGQAVGAATVEAYTVMHSRIGEPETAFAACLLPDGRRAWASSPALDVAAAMCVGEWIGRRVTIATGGTLHLP